MRRFSCWSPATVPSSPLNCRVRCTLTRTTAHTHIRRILHCRTNARANAVNTNHHSEEQREGSITFHTAFEDLQMVVRYHAIKGSLTIAPSIIQFDTPAFPGRLLNKAITAKSTYRFPPYTQFVWQSINGSFRFFSFLFFSTSRPIHISSITSSDARLIPLLSNTTLEPNHRSQIGYATSLLLPLLL